MTDDRFPPQFRPECGTRKGYQLHTSRNESPCPACSDANNAYTRDRYRATRARPRPVPRCGTDAAAQRHTRLGEPVDPACAEAQRAAARERTARYRARKQNAA
ncbi:hypothetical protein [Nocardiopsis sp. NPDC057823]|uniref:hypothetical protein n=1 Tax=Nocardiopsis sp. NPDC057823 TaxID=3346256 RepID=UPI0036702E74